MTITKRKYQYERPFCLIEKENCVDCWECVDNNYKGSARCDKCKIAIEKQKAGEE